MKNLTKSWQTTVAGIMAFIMLAWPELQTLWDGVAETMPDWNIVIGGLLTMLGLGAARDHGVSSEDAGVK